MRWVAFVRNVMLGREGLHREVLLEAARAAGGTDVRSHLTTGNLTLTADDDGADALAHDLETQVERVIGRREMVALRPLPWLADLVAGRLLDDAPGRAASCEVAFLRHDAPLLDPRRLEDPGRTVVVAVLERELLADRPPDGGRRPHVNGLLERASGRPATSRGWSTLERVVARGGPA